MRILVVEPDKDLARTMKKWLESEGYSVTVANDGQSALDVLDKDSVDLIILEIMMSGANGIELLQEVRTYDDWQDIPCVIYTRSGLRKSDLSDDVMERMGIKNVFYKSKDTLQNLSDYLKAGLA